MENEDEVLRRVYDKAWELAHEAERVYYRAMRVYDEAMRDFARVERAYKIALERRENASK